MVLPFSDARWSGPPASYTLHLQARQHRTRLMGLFWRVARRKLVRALRARLQARSAATLASRSA